MSPAKMSSFSILSLPALSLRALAFHGLAEGLEQRLLEAGLVGAALGRGDDVDEAAHRAVVADPPAQRDVDLAVPFDLGQLAVALLVEDRHGFLELARRRAAARCP